MVYAWETRTINLSPYAGNTVGLVFRFNTIDAIGNNYLGWQVDNILINASCTACSATQYQTAACSATQNTGCAPCTACSATEYQTAACTSTTNRSAASLDPFPPPYRAILSCRFFGGELPTRPFVSDKASHGLDLGLGFFYDSLNKHTPTCTESGRTR